MDFRAEYEIRVIRKGVKHMSGPCLMCDREIHYSNQISYLGIGWLRKQFTPLARKRAIRALRIDVPPKNRSLRTLEALICPVCMARLPKLRQDASAERDAELRRRAQLSALYHAKMEAERERQG